MTSHVVIEDSIIDQVLTLGGPDRRPAQNENIDLFIDQINFWAEISISLTVRGLQTVKLIDISAQKLT